MISTAAKQRVDCHRLPCQKITEQNGNQRVDISIGRNQRGRGDPQKPDVGDKSARTDHSEIGERESRTRRNSSQLEVAPLAAEESQKHQDRKSTRLNSS